VSSGEVTLVAAFISSSPGWAALYVTNRLALRKQTRKLEDLTAAQTEELKAHIASRAPDA
jgi:hypothetical protein